MTKLGRLEKIENLRGTWLDEARNFTPWLAEAENLAALSEFLGLGADGLELESVEKLVGPYRADILCRATATGDWVLIENQLEKTDHNHLGQVLVYAAGLEAKTIIWISKQVLPEHKAAMEWLNQISDGGPSFFALEIELWKIGTSELAPRFNLVVSPNDWTRSASTAKKSLETTELSELRQKQLKFWQEFEALIATSPDGLRPVKAQPQTWISHGIGKTGVSLNASISFRENWVRAEIYLGGKTAQTYFDQLLEHRGEIEAAFGRPLDWYDGADLDRRVSVKQSCDNLSDPAMWPIQQNWLLGQMKGLNRVFKDRVRRLDPSITSIFS